MKLSKTQALTHERMVRIGAVKAARLLASFPDGMDGKPVIPSDWLFMADLPGIRTSTLRSLIKAGVVESRRGQGWGTEYRVVTRRVKR